MLGQVLTPVAAAKLRDCGPEVAPQQGAVERRSNHREQRNNQRKS
jgi:hypothetical protein